jgi:predicted RNA-binding protein
METNQVTYWLLVERLENWQIDQRESFRRFGIPARKAKVASGIRRGDLLIFYISSSISAFSDVREAIADGTQTLRFGGDYDTPYPISVGTKPRITLPRERWIPLKQIASRVKFIGGKADWRQAMRNSVRRLDPEDGRLIVELIAGAAS